MVNDTHTRRRSEARYRLRIAIYAYHHHHRLLRQEAAHKSYILLVRKLTLKHLHLTPAFAMPFGAEKLEWCGYPTVKKFRRYVNSL